jgi:hypothetical protein
MYCWYSLGTDLRYRAGTVPLSIDFSISCCRVILAGFFFFVVCSVAVELGGAAVGAADAGAVAAGAGIAAVGGGAVTAGAGAVPGCGGAVAADAGAVTGGGGAAAAGAGAVGAGGGAGVSTGAAGVACPVLGVSWAVKTPAGMHANTAAAATI